MFSEERKSMISKYIIEHGRGSVLELSTTFRVSESTIRRDLKELEDDKLIKRTHGGAIPFESVNFEPTFGEKEIRYQSEKERIALYSGGFIQEGDIILIDSGTTTLHLAPILKAISNLTVVTNSMTLVEQLKNESNIDIVMLGGSLRQETQAIVGPITDQILQTLHVDTAFIATNGISLSAGLTTPNLIEANTKRYMMKCAKRTILLADHSKAEKISFSQFGTVADIDMWITDDHLPKEIYQKFSEAGTEIHVANSHHTIPTVS